MEIDAILSDLTCEAKHLLSLIHPAKTYMVSLSLLLLRNMFLVWSSFSQPTFHYVKENQMEGLGCFQTLFMSVLLFYFYMRVVLFCLGHN